MNNSLSRIYTIFFMLFFISTTALGQYGNEWINPGQTYYKIKVGSNGIYQVNYAALSDAGIPVNTINPKNIQLFRNGEEQHIFVAGEDDNSFD